MSEIAVVRWKDESSGEAGPIQLLTAEQVGAPSAILGRPFDPERPADPWFTPEQAAWLAEQLGARLEET